MTRKMKRAGGMKAAIGEETMVERTTGKMSGKTGTNGNRRKNHGLHKGRRTSAVKLQV